MPLKCNKNSVDDFFSPVKKIKCILVAQISLIKKKHKKYYSFIIALIYASHSQIVGLVPKVGCERFECTFNDLFS